jgi:hypothetical protein
VIMAHKPKSMNGKVHDTKLNLQVQNKILQLLIHNTSFS